MSEADNVYNPCRAASWGTRAPGARPRCTSPGGQGGHDGRRRHAGHPGRGAAGAHPDHVGQLPGALQQPELGGLRQLPGGKLQAGGLRHENIVRTYTLTLGRRYSFGCRHRLGTASNLAMCVSAADNNYVGVAGTFLGTAAHGVWSTARLDFSVPPGGVAKLRFGAFGGSIPGLVQQSAGTLPVQPADQGHCLQGRVGLRDGLLALMGSATLDGLTAQGNVGCDQLLCNDVNCTDVFTTGVDASGAISCAALTATGTVAR